VPELPDVTVYVEAIAERTVGQPLEEARLASPFLCRTADPPLGDARGHRVESVRRIGKRIVLALDGDLFLVFHLMIAGRFRWRERGAKIPGKLGLAAFDFPTGTLPVPPLPPPLRAVLPDLTQPEGPDDPARERRLDWAKLLKRAFAIDVLVCPRCAGPMRLLALIDDERIARKILTHLGLPTRAPPRGRPWRPPQESLPLDARSDHDAIDPPSYDA